MVSQTDALGQTTVFVYDELQRQVSKRREDGTPLAQYTYDQFDPSLGQYGRGRRTGMTDLSGSTHWTYDRRGRVTAETKTINGFGDLVTRFTYDALDRVVRITYPDGEVVVNGYDGQGLLESVSRDDGTYTYVENVDYNALGQMTLIEYGPANLNLSTDYAYNDENARLESLVTTGPYEVLQNLSYTYDAVGNVLSITDGMNGGQTQHFSYDPLDRLEHAWTSGGGQGGFDRTYAYDAIGNIIDKDGLTYYYDSNHPHAVEAVVWGTTQPGTYAYDANGNMVSRNQNGTLYALDYNYENRLASVTTGGETTTFVYDGDGSRVKKIGNSGDTTAYQGGLYEVSYPAPPGKLATGKLTNVGSSTWRTVVLSQTYDSMVVVAAPNYEGGDAPAVVRVRNAAGNSFQVRVQNPSDQPLSGYTVHYLVVEEGVYTQAQHGVKMEAVKYTSTRTDRAGSWIAESRSYQQSYAQPVVLGQVMTANDPDWSVFWARGSVQGNPPTSSYLFTGKHVGADTDTTRANETIGYLVIESGSGSIGGVAYVAGVGPDSVRGVDDSPPFNYTIGGPSTAEIALVSAAAMDGGDGGWPVLYGSAPVSASQLGLAFDEDQIRDAERNHTHEEVPYLVFSGSRTLPPPGVEVKKYYYVAGLRVAMRVDDGSTENLFYLHGDHLGSTSLVVTGNDMWAGALLVEAGREWSRQLFTPYGEIRWSRGVSPTDLQFTGQRREASLGLYDFGARFYDPYLGRFISPDTIVPEPGNPQSFNRYSYVYNNPLRYVDPEGHFAILPLLVTGAVGALVGATVDVAKQLLVDQKDWEEINWAEVGGAAAGGFVAGATLGLAPAGASIWLMFGLGGLGSAAASQVQAVTQAGLEEYLGTNPQGSFIEQAMDLGFLDPTTILVNFAVGAVMGSVGTKLSGWLRAKLPLPGGNVVSSTADLSTVSYLLNLDQPAVWVIQMEGRLIAIETNVFKELVRRLASGLYEAAEQLLMDALQQELVEVTEEAIEE
jgi:RHS repeat-associated protein